LWLKLVFSFLRIFQKVHYLFLPLDSDPDYESEYKTLETGDFYDGKNTGTVNAKRSRLEVAKLISATLLKFSEK
jgi:hypothetical protein